VISTAWLLGSLRVQARSIETTMERNHTELKEANKELKELIQRVDEKHDKNHKELKQIITDETRAINNNIEIIKNEIM
jgi:predicted phage gp36 major capsid-like protein